jgi:cytochrome P450
MYTRVNTRISLEDGGSVVDLKSLSAFVRGRMRDPLEVCVGAVRSGRPVTPVSFGPRTVYVVTDPDAVHTVLVEHPERLGRSTRGALVLRRTLGLSTLTAEGEDWRWRRRVVQPSFRAADLAGADVVIREVAEQVADRMAAATTPYDVFHETSDLALAVVCRVLFDDDLGSDRAVVHEKLTTILAEYLPLTTSPWPMPDRMPTPRAIRYRRARRELSGVLERVVARRRARGPVDDLLGALLSAKRPEGCPLHAADLDAEGVTMLLAGHETTASAMAWTLGLLSRHPSVRRRLQHELEEVLGDRPVTTADLASLPVLDAVVKESLRLFPPAWVLSRSANVALTLAGTEVPKGAFLFVPIHALHRHPAHWDDPEGFDPDRWLDGRGERAKKAGMYLPFGMGQRRCVGEHLANLEARVALATLLRRVTPELLAGQELVPEASVTLRPKGGLWMRTASAPRAAALAAK